MIHVHADQARSIKIAVESSRFKKLFMQEIVTIKDYLENIVKKLNNKTEKEYVIRCFSYPIVYEFYGSHKDSALGYNTKQEGIIAITTKNFDVKNIFQGYLCYPEEYSDFYEKGDFILCFGPDESLLNFEQILEEPISDLDMCNYFYGLPEINKAQRIL